MDMEHQRDEPIRFAGGTLDRSRQVVLDPTGYIRTNSQMQTSRSHVYAAGEIRFGAHRQLVTAAADGAVAAMSAARDVGGV
jgi:thioredoxin reductase (NADPH)